MALVELRVRDLAVLATVQVVPGARLTVLTGETGAGKSLCITALRLALGARDDQSAGERGASVAAVFDEVPDAVHALLEAHGIADDELLTLSRDLPAAGRGACRVNGALVSLSTLRAIGEELVEVTAQGESHRLLRPARQRALVDAFGGRELLEARTQVASAVLGWRRAETALRDALAGAEAGTAALEQARELAAELEPLRLRAGEDAELAVECRRLRHAAALSAAVSALRLASGGGDDATGAADALAAAVVAARGVAGVDAEVDALLAAGEEEAERLRDLAARARDLLEALDVDEGRLAEVEERLDVLDRVRRRQGGSIETALERLDAARSLLDAAECASDLPERCRAALAHARGDAAGAAARLSRLRAAAAARLERAVTARLRDLRLRHARFRVVLARVVDPSGLELDGEWVACGAEGIDGIEFRLATSADGVPIPLSDGVSGGELSRVALAVRSVVAAEDDCPTLVLDEVDTGLGGETAARVGEVLASVAEHRQLLVVTHRPEIAARADDHLLVSRRDAAGPSDASVAPVAGEERALEIARLMSGRTTAAAIARAVELLAEGARPARRPSARTMAPS
jgi:DNA repair protein RecN (Recombination protein N)